MPGPLEEYADQPTPAELYQRTAQPERFGNDPRRRDVVNVPLDAGDRAVIMEALEFWHNNGPRARSCRETQLAMLRVEVAVEAARQGELAAGPGWEPPPPIEDQLQAASGQYPAGVIDVEFVEDT
jgi:hypothetical protein